MPTTHNPVSHTPLRRAAEALITGGAAPPARTWATGAEALALLYGLASDPAKAGDALKLLHELQVHQVELDLQHEQIEQGRHELAVQRDQYLETFEFAPVGYLRLERGGRIMEANLACIPLLGIGLDELEGRAIGSFFAPANRAALQAALERAGDGGSAQTCELMSAGDGSEARMLRIVVSAAPGAKTLLAVLSESRDAG